MATTDSMAFTIADAIVLQFSIVRNDKFAKQNGNPERSEGREFATEIHRIFVEFQKKRPQIPEHLMIGVLSQDVLAMKKDGRPQRLLWRLSAAKFYRFKVQ